MRKRLSALACLGVAAAAAWPSGAQAQAAFTSYARYDAAHRLTGTIAPDPDGTGPLGFAAVRDSYDAAGRLVRQETGQIAQTDTSWMDGRAPSAWAGFAILETVDTAYDALDRKVSETLSAGGVAQTLTQYSYDGSGRLECTAVRMNPAAFGSLPASACTLGSQGSQGPDRIARNVYDAAGEVLKVQKAYGTALQQDYATYEYTLNGQQKAVTDANGNRAELTYDGHDREARWVFPSPSGGGVANQADYEQYGYDANGNRTSLRKRDGTSLTYAYDALNRVTQKAVPASASGAAAYTVNYTYDNRGLQLAATFAASGQGLANSYDNVGRLTSATITMGGVSRTISHGYDADGNRTQVTHPDSNAFTYEYDGLDRATAVRENGSTVLATFTYDAQGHRSGQGYAGAASSYGYDAAGRLSSLGHDLVGTSADQVLTFGYNAASQMITRTASNDAFASTTAYNVSRGYSINGLNQYIAAGSATFGYDGNGNLTADGSTGFVYDAENRLVSASGARTASLIYDPNGRLFQTSGGSAGTTQMVYDGDELVATYKDGTMTERYVHGNGEDDPLIWYDYAASGYRRGLFTDHQGSVIAASDSSGNPVGTNAYDPWGIPNSTSIATVGRFGYTGQAWLPELGMYYYKARIYSPTLGRFLQTDPIGYKDQINLYAYVGNDAVNGRDPTGLHECAKGTDCTKFEAYRQRLIVARDKFEKGSKDYSRINASLTRIGEPGTKGITVVEGGLNVKNPGSAANMSGDGSGVLTIYTQTLEQSAKVTGTNTTDYGAAVIGHEADPLHSGGFRTREDRFNGEISGYRTQDAVNRALRVRMWPTFDPTYKHPNAEGRIREAAEASVEAACRNTRPGDGAC